MYKEIWESSIGKILDCGIEDTNRYDCNAVAVVKSRTIVGHVPKKISFFCELFLRRSGFILCEVIGGRQYSSDLPQGGLEVLCRLNFKGMSEKSKKAAQKPETLIKKVLSCDKKNYEDPKSLL